MARTAVPAAGGWSSGHGAAKARREEPAITGSPRPAHDFSRIPIHAAPPAIQPKLRINTPGDHYEREADHVAEQVMRMPEPGPHHARPASPAAGNVEAPAIVPDVLRSPGQPLDASTRAFMEPRFGHDFSQVRIHDDATAGEAASAIRSRAFAAGSHVVFAASEYAPQTDGGRRLLAHELTHVVQQSREQWSPLHASGAPHELTPINMVAAPGQLMRQASGADTARKLTSPLFAGITELEMAYAGELVIGPGASGEFVRRIQIALLADDPKALPQSGADGHYGPETEAAVKRYQKSHCLRGDHGKITVLAPDGVIGPETMGCLDWVTPPSAVNLADMSRLKSNADPYAKMRDAGVDLLIDGALDLVEEGLDWGAEKLTDRRVKQGYVVDTYGKERKLTRKTKSGEPRHMGGGSKRGPWTTKNGARPYSSTAKGMKRTSKFIGDALGPAMDMADLPKMMTGETSPMSAIVDLLVGGLPLSMVAEDRIEEMDDLLFEAALNAGYQAAVEYIKNCNSCRKMTDGMAMLYVTDSEYSAASADQLVMTESLRKRVLPVYQQTQSGLASYAKLSGVEAPLKFALLIYWAEASVGKAVSPIAGFEVP